MKIKLISTSDVHGYLAPTDYSRRDNIAPLVLVVPLLLFINCHVKIRLMSGQS